MATEVKSSGVAMVLSFFYPGLGQLYAGRVGRGLVMFVTTPVVYLVAFFGGGFSLFAGGVAASEAENAAVGGAAGLVGVALICSAFAWWLFVLLDARKCCDTFNAEGEEKLAGV